MSDDWHHHYHADFLDGVADMALEDIGAYIVLLDTIYLLNRPLKDDDRYLAGLLRCDIRKWRAIRSRLLATGKVVEIEGGFIDNRRAIEERSARDRTKITRRSAGHKGGIASGKIRKTNDITEASASSKTNQIRGEEKREEKIRKKNKDAVPNGTAPRASSIPPDWMPSPENLAWAQAKGFSRDFLERETERHQMWAEARGITRKDWGKSWQNWLLRTSSEQPQNGHGRSTGPPRRDYADEVMRARERIEQRIGELDEQRDSDFRTAKGFGGRTRTA